MLLLLLFNVFLIAKPPMLRIKLEKLKQNFWKRTSKLYQVSFPIYVIVQSCLDSIYIHH
jgi:hypothetical protein